MQLVIMMTPVRVFFQVRAQSWKEWLFAIGGGLGSIPLSLLTRLILRLITKSLHSRGGSKISSVHPVLWAFLGVVQCMRSKRFDIITMFDAAFGNVFSSLSCRIILM